VGSILIIKNSYEIDPKLLELLEAEHQVYIESETWGGLDVIDEHHIDVFVVMSDDHVELSIWEFLKAAREGRSRFTPIIFISKQQNDVLQSEINKRGSWYFLLFPVNQEDFLTIVEDSMEMVGMLDEKTIILEKSGHAYPYKVKDISRVERTPKRRIKIYSQKPGTNEEEEEEFFFDEPLEEFIKIHGIGTQIKKAYQSFLVNASHVKEVRKVDKELVLRNGVVVPTSKKFIDNFVLKTSKK